MNASAHLVTLFDVGSHAPLGSSVLESHIIRIVTHVRLSLSSRLSLSTSICPSPSVSLTGYEPNYMAFSELGDSQGSFSYITPSSDQDIDDATLRKLLTEATEDKPITAIQKACQSVSRRCLSCSIEQGNLWEKEMSISQLVLVSRETRTVLTASFLKTPKLRRWSIEHGNLRSETAQMHRLGPCLMNRDK